MKKHSWYKGFKKRKRYVTEFSFRRLPKWKWAFWSRRFQTDADHHIHSVRIGKCIWNWQTPARPTSGRN